MIGYNSNYGSYTAYKKYVVVMGLFFIMIAWIIYQIAMGN